MLTSDAVSVEFTVLPTMLWFSLGISLVFLPRPQFVRVGRLINCYKSPPKQWEKLIGMWRE